MFRLDRFLTLYFFHPLVKRRLSPEIKVPILMYHGISDAKRKGIHPYYETTTSPSVFSAHMRFLRANNYRIIGECDLPVVFANPADLGGRCAVITFDDGLLDFDANAFPILRDNGHTATVFLPAGLMGQRLTEHLVMTWDHARELFSKGVTFGSHSMTHPKLIELGKGELEREIRGSKYKIESELGGKINSFSYPYAFPEHNNSFLDSLAKILTGCGYKSGVTTIIGRSSGNDNRLFQKRLPVNTYDDIQFFKAKLEGGYDWLHGGQKIFKRSKHIVNRA